MGEAATFVLGVCVGVILYWLVYRMFWHRWRKYQEQDMKYLRSKVESAQFTSLGLERQITTQKADFSEQHARINTLERENWQAQAKLAELNAEKQSLVMHLDTLRGELAAYKKAVTEVDPPTPSLPHHGNGKSQVPLSTADTPQQARLPAPANNMADFRKETPRAGPPPAKRSNGKMHANLPPEQVMEPVLIIARPHIAGDRLEIIQGIGPAIIKKLNRAGIDTFQALSQLTPERLKELVGARTAKLMDAESVIHQAKKLVGDRRSRSGSD